MDNNKNSKRNWLVRHYKDDDDDLLFEFYHSLDPDRYNSKETWYQWWKWQYKEFPNEIITFIIDDNGKIVGHIASEIINIKIGNKFVSGRFPLDYAVHPEYRLKGVASALTVNVIEYFKNNHNHISYGVPNQLGYKLAMKQGYLYVGNWKKFIKVLDWKLFLKKYISNKPISDLFSFCANMLAKLLFPTPKLQDISGLVIKKELSFDERIDTFLAAFSEKVKIMRMKSRDYLNWRYTTYKQPIFDIFIAEKSGTICGYMVLRIVKEEMSDRATIFEFAAESQLILRHMISVVCEHCSKKGISYISWVGLAEKSNLQAFRKQGFFSMFFSKSLKFIVYSDHPDIPEKFLANPHNWFIQSGDFDI
jgi:GNAT superfamily N-acetyltransferase